MSVSTVSATGIQDPTGQVFANGTWRLEFVPTYGTPGIYNDGGLPFTKQYSGSLDVTGSFSQVGVNRNDTIAPAGSQWRFTAIPAVNGTTYSVLLNVNTPAFDVTAAINAVITNIVVSPTSISRAYKDAELVNVDGSGAIYYDETLKVLKVWDAVTSTFLPITPNNGSPTFNNLTVTGQALVKNLENILFANEFAGADIGAKINAAAVALGITGGTIIVPQGTYFYSTQIALDGTRDITIQGAGGVTAGASAATELVWTGIGSAVSARTTTAFRLTGIQFVWNNAGFTGPVIDLGQTVANTFKAEVDHCGFFSATTLNIVIIRLDQAIDSTIHDNIFSNYGVAIRGSDTSATITNNISIYANDFSSSTGTAITAHIQNVGQGWTIWGNAFEMGQAAGTPAVIGFTNNAAAANANGVDVFANWIGDQSANGVQTMFTVTTGFNFHGNFINGGGTNTTLFNFLNGAQGNVISGNSINTAGVAFAFGANNVVSITGNFYAGITSFSTGIPGNGSLITDNTGLTTVYGGLKSVNLLTSSIQASFTEIAAPAGVASSDLLYGNSTTHRLMMNNNNTGALTIAATSGDTFTSTTLTSPVVNGTPTGTGIQTTTFKVGTGAGNYTSASTTYVRVDSTNLAYTVVIPNGWKLVCRASMTALTITAAVQFGIALADGSADNTGILIEKKPISSSATVGISVDLEYVVNGDGASHTINLQYLTTNAADSVLIANGTATFKPVMSFLLIPSN